MKMVLVLIFIIADLATAFKISRVSTYYLMILAEQVKP